jgi:hypothetical protein
MMAAIVQTNLTNYRNIAAILPEFTQNGLSYMLSFQQIGR